MDRKERLWFRRETLSAAIAFVIAGIGGALVQQCVSRARPQMSLTSVGFFLDADEIVAVPASTRAVSLESHWDRPFDPFENLGSLNKRERRYRERIQAMRAASASMNVWLIKVANSRTPLSAELVTQFPLFSTETAGAIINGSIDTGELTSLPVRSVDVMKQPAIGYAQVLPNAVDIRIGLNGTRLMLPENYSPEQREVARLIGESIVHGSKENLDAIGRYFVRRCGEEGQILKRLRDELERVLVSRSRLMVKVSIANTGGTAFTIRPYMALEAFAPKQRPFRLTLGVDDVVTKAEEQRKMIETALSRMPMPAQREDRGAEAHADEFLRTSSASPYVSIPPGEVKEITALSLEPLGDRGAAVRSGYEQGTLSCSLRALGVNGRKIVAERTAFGEKIGAAEQKAVNHAFD